MAAAAKAAGNRGFDKDKAVAAAMREFWRRGFEGVSIDDLTAAMGVSRPTLYAAFGGKEDLFRRALEHYEREEGAFYREAAEAPSAKGVAEALLRGALKLFPGDATPPGCLYVAHLVARGAEADAVRAEMMARARVGEKVMRQRFERAAAEGDLDPAVDPVALAYMLLGLVQGLAVQASSGVPRAAMKRTVGAVLAAWPFLAVAPDASGGMSPSRSKTGPGKGRRQP